MLLFLQSRLTKIINNHLPLRVHLGTLELCDAIPDLCDLMAQGLLTPLDTSGHYEFDFYAVVSALKFPMPKILTDDSYVESFKVHEVFQKGRFYIASPYISFQGIWTFTSDSMSLLHLACHTVYQNVLIKLGNWVKNFSLQNTMFFGVFGLYWLSHEILSRIKAQS